MTTEAYQNAIKTAGKYIIMIDNDYGTTEVQKVFNSPEEACKYASGKIKHTKNNKIDIYKTTGMAVKNKIRNDIVYYQKNYVGSNW